MAEKKRYPFDWGIFSLFLQKFSAQIIKYVEIQDLNKKPFTCDWKNHIISSTKYNEHKNVSLNLFLFTIPCTKYFTTSL